MQLLLLLLSVVTFTVQSKNSVSMDGSWPYDIEVNYANTYNKGQVRAGDTATLSLSHLDGISVSEITVGLKSNKSGGAGTFTVWANTQQVATQSGSLKDWTGSYDNENIHEITLLEQSVNDVDDLVIQLVGTANSLHIDYYTITWSPTKARTVTLMKGNTVYATMTEPAGMQGVLLPGLSDSAEWKFRGWSETHFLTVYELPPLIAAGSKYYPEEDCTLWAVYAHADGPEQVYMEELTSGVYSYVNRTLNIALTGVPYTDGTMDEAPISLTDMQQRYQVDFDGDQAFITHLTTGTPIGYSGTKLTVNASPWSVYHEGDQTLFYTTVNNKNYVLWLNIMDSNFNTYAGLLQADPMNSPMALQLPVEPSDPVYTCHPEMPQSIELTNEGMNELKGERILMNVGSYELRLINGQKELRRR